MDDFASSLGFAAAPTGGAAFGPEPAFYACNVSPKLVKKASTASRHFAPASKKLVAALGGAAGAGIQHAQNQARFRKGLVTPAGTFAVAVSERGIHLQAGAGSSGTVIGWAHIDTWLEARDYLLLSAKGRAVILPKAELPLETIDYITATCTAVAGQGLTPSGITRSADPSRHRVKVGMIFGLIGVAVIMIIGVIVGGADGPRNPGSPSLGDCDFAVVQADGSIVCR